MKMLWAYLKDESGQTSTEYILLVAVVAMIIFKFKNVANTKLIGVANTVFGGADEMAQKINQDAMSGN